MDCHDNGDLARSRVNVMNDVWHFTRNDQLPTELRDVMVSVQMPGDTDGIVYMAYRCDGDWFLTGTRNHRITDVYAWTSIIQAAPLRGALHEIRRKHASQECVTGMH